MTRTSSTIRAVKTAEGMGWSEGSRGVLQLRHSTRSAEPASTQLDPSNGKAPVGVLTPRQIEVARLIADGFSNEQIAQRLWLTPGTVANHVANIFCQLSLHSRVQVATWMMSRQHTNELEAVMALLDQLRNVRGTTLAGALRHAANVLAEVFVADKVDSMLCDASAGVLVTIGTSDTPMSERQHELGLDRLSLAHGGRAVWVYDTRREFHDGCVELDATELPAIREDLGVRSSLIVPLEINTSARGVLLASSAQPEHFSATQLRLLQFVAYWIGLVVRDTTD